MKRLRWLLPFLFCGILYAGGPEPLPLPRVRLILLAPGEVPANPTGINGVSVAAFDSVNTALKINDSSGGAWAGAFPNDADQVFSAIWDAANSAVRVNCVVGCGNGGTVGPGTVGTLAEFGPGTTQVRNSVLDNGVTVAGTVSTSEPINIQAQNIEQSALANDGTTGTTLHALAQRTTASPATWIIASTSSTTVFGVCNATCGKAGSPQIVEIGSASCIFDNATTAGDYVGVSTSVAGDCTDLGATFPTTGAEVVGIVNTTNGAAGTFAVDFNPPDLTLPNAGGGGGGGGGSKSNIKINGTQSKNITNFNSTTPAAGANTLNIPFASSASGNTTSAAVNVAITGNTSTLASFTGAATSARCVDIDASGNLKATASDCGTSSAVTGSKIALDSCTQDTTGLVGPNVVALTNWRQSMWQYNSANAIKWIDCTFKVPHNFSANGDIVIDTYTFDSTAGHTYSFKEGDVIVSTTLDNAAPTLSAAQTCTTTTTAWAPCSLTFAIQSTLVADAQVHVRIEFSASASMAQDVLMATPKFQWDGGL